MTTHQHSRSVLLLFFCFLTSIIYSQKTPEEVRAIKEKILKDPNVSSVLISGERQTPSMIVFKASPNSYTKDKAGLLLADYLSVRPGTDQLQQSKRSSLFNNFEVIEFQQYFKGIRVEHASYKALVKNDNILYLN